MQIAPFLVAPSYGLGLVLFLLFVTCITSANGIAKYESIYAKNLALNSLG